jgi:hypothetical protein
MYKVPKDVVKTCAACNVEKSLINFTVSGREGYRNKRCKICVKNKKFEVIVGNDSKRCTSCSQVKLLQSFYKRTHLKDGYDTRCKNCVNNQLYSSNYFRGKEKYIKDPAFDEIFRLKRTTEKDYIETYKFFERIGYDLKSPKTIHQQFCERHNLNEHIRKQPFPNYRSKESLKDFLY